MELEDIILSTIQEMQEGDLEKKVLKSSTTPKVVQPPVQKQDDSELIFLNSMRERLLVLFEGFQSPNNIKIEAKVDMTINFLEYALATIDERAKHLSKGAKR